jgi:HEAT repeat protein
LGASHPEVLLAGLTDEQEIVRVQAVKGLGWNDIQFPIGDALPLLQSADPRVRITTIRAIERAMPQSLGKHPIFESLTNDPNSKVQREIQRFYPQ